MSLRTLTHLTESLVARKAMPKHLEVAKVGRIHMVNAFSAVDSQIISNNVTTGTDISLTTATLKALTEFFERNAFLEGYRTNDVNCLTERSDGFAAYPTSIEGFKEKARDNALCEAIERYSWATWWDDTEIAYAKYELDWNTAKFWKQNIDVLSEINDIFQVSKIQMIKPILSNYKEKLSIFIFCELKGNKVISGGACGSDKELGTILVRALGEVFRHAIALKQIIYGGHKPQSFYEKRLALFGSEEGFKIYKERLAIAGDMKIEFPELEIDSAINHSFSDLFYVHRCLFKNQPPFIGGDLARFCL